MSRTIQLGLLGCGVVGTGMLRVLRDHAAMIERRLGSKLEVRRIAVRHPAAERDAVVPANLLVADPLQVVDDPQIDIVVELMGGLEPAGSAVRAALEQGKHVVTANKALVAEQGSELLQLAEARRVDFYFEAAVAGGIPIIRVLREALASDRIRLIQGIVNGTSNYILSRMQAEGLGFTAALSAAQAAGYAEADPHLDVSGGDARHKIAILAALAFGAQIDLQQIPTAGIERVAGIDMRFADRFGYTIKPLAVARMTEAGVLDLRVHPALVPKQSMLAAVHGATNAVYLEGAMVGPSMLTGLGAGALPTATSVVSDIVDVGRNLLVNAHGRVPSRSVPGASLHRFPLEPTSAQRSRFYLRFVVVDRPGVLARIAGVLGRCDVSIEQMMQEGQAGSENAPVSVVMLTHRAAVAAVQEAVAAIEPLADVIEPARAFRVEE